MVVRPLFTTLQIPYVAGFLVGKEGRSLACHALIANYCANARHYASTTAGKAVKKSCSIELKLKYDSIILKLMLSLEVL